METKAENQKFKVTGWHWLAGALCFTLVSQIFYWEKTDKRTAKVGQLECEEKLDRLQKNYLRLYDTLSVWKPIIKNHRSH